MSDAKATATRVPLNRTWTVKSVAVIAISLVFGGFAVVTFFVGSAGVAVLVAGIVLFVIGAVLLLASFSPSDWLQVGPDAISQWHGRAQLWQLRWEHMAAVRVEPESIWLVPLDAVAGHPEIAPALEPHDVDGVTRPAFGVQLGPAQRTQEAARTAITRHAPPPLLAQSSPRPPST